jgi:flagellar motor switch protein FliM
MSGLLSEDAIAALVDAARDGELPSDAPAESAGQRRGRAPSIRVVDFHRTVKFKSEHQDRLKRAAETFCRVATTRVTSELRSMASLELMQVEQGMWSRVHAELAPTSLCAVLAAAEERPPLIMAVEQPLVLEAVDRLLGGDGRSEIVDRPLTEVDRLIARRFFNTLAYCLGQAWKELCGEEIGLQRIMGYEQVADVCAIEEPTLVLTIEVKLDRVSTVMAVLVPFNAIGALLARIRSAPAPDPASGTALAANLGDIHIDLRAEVGATELTAAQVLALKPGDVVPLATHAKGAAQLYADGVALTTARPGRNGRRRAVQIDSSLGEDR